MAKAQKSPQELVEDALAVFEIIEGLWEQDKLAEIAWQPALRFASTTHGAPARCSRRKCQMAGECRMVVGEAPSLACDGGLPDETLTRAAEHVVFTVAMLQSYALHMVTEIPAILELLDARLGGPPRRKGGAARKQQYG